ncbi:MAG TPA: metallophosphoesterase family protein [Gaiellaceae bacterium]|nr:metallophosphoesterase family protein [Gaiellaceae bacterium]
MRVAVISDVHGNLHALEAVLAALAEDAPDEVWSLGDVVGYGPRPNPCCELVAARARIGLAGNHDLGVLGAIDLDEFSNEAAESARWTRTVLLDESRAYLEKLPSQATAPDAQLFHASPRDPVWDYVLTADAALEALELTEAPVVLVGHSHVALAIGLDSQELSGGLAPAGHEVDLSRGRWLLNPGSVGQPRDGDPRAAYLLLDREAQQARFCRVSYAVERTQAEIRERNLPDALAHRLAHGV